MNTYDEADLNYLPLDFVVKYNNNIIKKLLWKNNIYLINY